VIGTGGRGHGTEFDPAEVERWLLEKYFPRLAERLEENQLKAIATGIYDCLKRDGLQGQTLPVEQMAGKLYERCYRNIKKAPLLLSDLPDDLRRVFLDYIDSAEAEKIQRR
jgi:hypothetical protein